MYTIDEVISEVIKKNKLSEKGLDKTFTQVFYQIMDWIPEAVKAREAFTVGSRGSGKYLSVTYCNYLIFRTPGYSDKGKSKEFDVTFLSQPSKYIKVYEDFESIHLYNDHFVFGKDRLVSIYLEFEDIFKFGDKQISDFRNTCDLLIGMENKKIMKKNIEKFY